MRLYKESKILIRASSIHVVFLPAYVDIRRTIIEWTFLPLERINLIIDGGMSVLHLFREEASILGLLDGTTVLHSNWGIVDYRMVGPEYVFLSEGSGILGDKIHQASLEFHFGHADSQGEMNLYHEVLPALRQTS